MSESPHDLRDYLFDELSPAEHAEVDGFLKASPEARAELEQLRLTHKALLSLPQEEIPRRIAFVSDPVMEPSGWQRFWSELLSGGPRFAMGMAAALLVFFGGVWATEPTLNSDESGWTLAFGAQPAVVAEPTPTGITEEQLRAAVNEALAAGEARQLEAMAELKDAYSGELERVRRELSEVHEDAVAGYEIVNMKHEKLRKQLFEVDLASLELGR